MPHKRPWLLTIGVLGILLLSWNPAAWLFSRPLEMGYDHSPLPAGSADAIVVLAGAVTPPMPDQPYALAAHDTYIRVTHAAWLFNHWARRPILACGGGDDSESYSFVMRRLLESAQVDPDLIWIEDRSRSTYENALFASRILRGHGISRVAVVTDARSMARAAAAFRKQGITVVPAPLGFLELSFSAQDLLPMWGAIKSNGETAHELAGLLWYRLRTWI